MLLIGTPLENDHHNYENLVSRHNSVQFTPQRDMTQLVLHQSFS